MSENSIDLLVQLLAEMNKVKSISINSAKEIFFSILKIKNVRSSTTTYYKNLFYRLDKDFVKFNINETNQLDTKNVSNLISNWIDEGLSNNYINKLIKAIRYILKLLKDYDYISTPCLKVELLKEEENRINKIEDNDLNKIIDYVLTSPLKYQAIIFVLLYTGVRRTELTQILLRNVNLTNNSILLETTKVGEIRTVFFTSEVNIILNRYLESYKPIKYLFEVSPGVAYKPEGITRILDRIKKSLNLDTLSAHQFRHTFATKLFEASCDIEFTRVLLGHHDTTMTMRYIHHSTSINKERYDKLNLKLDK